MEESVKQRILTLLSFIYLVFYIRLCYSHLPWIRPLLLEWGLVSRTPALVDMVIGFLFVYTPITYLILRRFYHRLLD